jgi:membrane protease subunit HflK
MPWNNQSGGGGGWKSGGGGGGGGGGPWGGGPWGQGPSGGGGGGQQPDLEEILKRSQDRLKQVMPGSGLPGPLMLLIAAVGAAVVAFYAFTFRVNPDELGVVMRFGQFVRQEPPGLHFRLPYPIEEVRLPAVTRQNIIEIGRRSPSTGRPPAQDSGLMLTGDENIVDMSFVVFWRIRTEQDPKTGQSGVAQYLFNIAAPETTVREVAESAMREVVGQSNLQSLLTEGRQKTEQQVQKLMQDTLDSYGSGIRIDQIQLKEVDPPAAVIAAFRDVQAAVADRERIQKEAQTYADQIVPRARGEAERILAAANGYREQTVAEATGQAARFVKVYDEYKKAPDVTRQRLFLEMQERVLTGADKIILDNNGNSGQGVVPLLPLDQIQRRPPTAQQGSN